MCCGHEMTVVRWRGMVVYLCCPVCNRKIYAEWYERFLRKAGLLAVGCLLLAISYPLPAISQQLPIATIYLPIVAGPGTSSAPAKLTPTPTVVRAPQ